MPAPIWTFVTHTFYVREESPKKQMLTKNLGSPTKIVRAIATLVDDWITLITIQKKNDSIDKAKNLVIQVFPRFQWSEQ